MNYSSDLTDQKWALIKDWTRCETLKLSSKLLEGSNAPGDFSKLSIKKHV